MFLINDKVYVKSTPIIRNILVKEDMWNEKIVGNYKGIIVGIELLEDKKIYKVVALDDIPKYGNTLYWYFPKECLSPQYYNQKILKNFQKTLDK